MASKAAYKSRYLTLLDVADCLGVEEGKPARDRRRHVQRLFEALEKRDKRTYLHRSAPGTKGNRITVCVDDLAALDPWDPSTTTALRNDLDALVTENRRLRKRVKKLEEFCEAVSDHLRTNRSQPTAQKIVH